MGILSQGVAATVDHAIDDAVRVGQLLPGGVQVTPELVAQRDDVDHPLPVEPKEQRKRGLAPESREAPESPAQFPVLSDTVRDRAVRSAVLAGALD